MKYTVALLVSAVTAEEAIFCDYVEFAWENTDLTSSAVTDTDTCKTACDTAIAAAEAPTTFDYCGETYTYEGEIFCSLFSIAAAGEDVRKEVPINDELYSAWAW